MNAFFIDKPPHWVLRVGYVIDSNETRTIEMILGSTLTLVHGPKR
jgi:hypothetical protein